MTEQNGSKLTATWAILAAVVIALLTATVSISVRNQSSIAGIEARLAAQDARVERLEKKLDK